MNGQQLPAQFYSGISGLQLPIPKYLYPPPYQDSSRLTYYASLFNSIEFNSTFYKLPKAATVSNWAQSVPENFRFTFKLWKQVTHNKGFEFDEGDVELFMNVVSAVGEKKGCLLIQFPPSLGKEYIMQLDRLLSSIKRLDPGSTWKVAVEFRNSSWYHQGTYELLELHHAAMVRQDIPKSATPAVESDANFEYIRFHGPTGNYRDGYDEDFLYEYAGYISEWVEGGKTVYVYFNNTMGDALVNLKTLNSFVSDK